MGAYLNTRTKVVSASTASSTFTVSVPAMNYGYLSFQVIWTNHNSGNATVKLQSTIDGANYNDYQSSTVTIPSGTSNQVYEFVKPTGAYAVRVYYDPGTATLGTLDVWVNNKGHVG